MNPTRTAILERLIMPEEPSLSAEAARAILKVTFRPEDRQHVLDLLEKNQEGKLTPNEREELEEYVRVDDLLSLLQSKARLSLRQAGLGTDS
jgi:hypothetical protein